MPDGQARPQAHTPRVEAWPGPEYSDYNLVVVDPIYKVLTGNENSATDMGAFCNQFDRVCAELGCFVVYCHHHSKGFQGAKAGMDRMSGSGVFARDPDAILDMKTSAATAQELRCARDRAALAEIRRTLDARGVRYPRFDDAVPFSVWAYDHMYRDDARALQRRLSGLLEGTKDVTAWRVSYTLREFPGIGHTEVWFDHPLHVMDARGVLASCPLDGPGGEVLSTDGSGRTRAQARDEKQQELVDAFQSVAGEDGAADVDEIAAALGVSARTVRRRVDESARLSRSNGRVTMD